MSKAQHTPGHWTTSIHFGGAQVYGDRVCVADVYGKDRKANAHLISAAPELLAYAEFQRAVDLYEYDDAAYSVLVAHGWTKDHNLTPVEYARQMRATAIAKATNQQVAKAA